LVIKLMSKFNKNCLNWERSTIVIAVKVR